MPEGTGRAELDDSQGLLYQAFRAKWLGNKQRELADKQSALSSYTDQVPSSQVSEGGTARTRGRTAPSKKATHRVPRVKWQSFPEIMMMLDASVVRNVSRVDQEYQGILCRFHGSGTTWTVVHLN